MQSLETAVRDDEKFVETVCFFGKEGAVKLNLGCD